MIKKTFFLTLLFFLSQASASLLEDEKNSIQIYQKAASNVVSVHRFRQFVDEFHQPFILPRGMGSGFIWDKKGHIITNYHVIRGSRIIAVTLDNLTVKAKLVGAEPRKDIAVLKVSSKKALKKIKQLSPFKIAPSATLLVGQKTLAIGNPFGLDHTLTTGVISALGRRVPGLVNTINDMIQTDASINPGNSGGPLLDSQGRLVGMNTVIYSQSGGSAGIGFAVSANDIERIANQIIENGRVKLAGIGVERVDDTIARKLGVSHGVLIGRFMEQSPAKKAGLKGTYRDGFGYIHLGDIIVAVNGHKVRNYDDLYNIMSDINIGSQVNIKVRRDDDIKHFTIKTIDIAGKL